MHFVNEFTALIHSCHIYSLSENVSCSSPFFEILAVLDGAAVFSPLTSPLEEKDVFLLPPGINTAVCPDVKCTLLRLSLAPEQLLDILDDAALFSKPVFFNDDRTLFSQMISYSLFTCSPDCGDTFQSASLLLPMIGQLKKSCPPTYTAISDTAKITLKQQQFLKNILQYVQENFRDEISLSEAAIHFNVTPQYFASFFKKFMHQTFHQYIQGVRCEKGGCYLKYTSLSAEKVCQKVGLNQSTLLTDLMRKAEVPIETFDMDSQFGNPISPDAAMELLSKYKSCTPPASFLDHTADIITADSTVYSPFSDSFRRLINLGYATDFSDILVFRQLMRAQDEIGFTYGRICRLFDLTAEYSIGGRTIYDYNRIFRLLDVMVNHKMMPFLELSNKLFRIHLSLLEVVPVNLIKDSVAYYDKIVEILPDFIRACINRYGQDCVNQWKFEISYTNYDFAESAENFPLMKYVRYFRKIKEIIKSFSLHCQIGGPGFNYWQNTQRLSEILSIFQANQALPDFVTAYIYPLTRDDADASLSSDENLTLKRFSAIRDLTQKQYPKMEVWITEFNSNLSSRNLLNDSSYQAAFLAKTLSAASDIGIHALGYYLLTDVPLRYVDSLDLLFGGWGLFSDCDIPKPSYHTYSLFAKLGSFLLKYQKNLLLTCNSDCSFQCLLFHYEHIAPAFLAKNVGIRDIGSPDTLFCSSAPETKEILIEHARPGTYLVKEYIISDTKSNLLKEWSNIDFLTPSKAPDVLALKTSSQLIPKLHTIEVKPQKPLTFSATLKHQEVRLLMIDLVSTLNRLQEVK